MEEVIEEVFGAAVDTTLSTDSFQTPFSVRYWSYALLSFSYTEVHDIKPLSSYIFFRLICPFRYRSTCMRFPYEFQAFSTQTKCVSGSVLVSV